MIIDITPTNYGKDVEIKKTLSFRKEELENTGLLDLQNVKINGRIKNDNLGNLSLFLNITGKMILPCSRTLEPTDYKFAIDIEENIEENEEKLKKTKKTIDILPIIWENILMEIPIKIVNPDSENIKLKGDGWELITDNES